MPGGSNDSAIYSDESEESESDTSSSDSDSDYDLYNGVKGKLKKNMAASKGELLNKASKDGFEIVSEQSTGISVILVS